jgi:N-acetylmuramic acid 6-phosphate etherase
MIDVKATNVKLKQRARNILRFVGGGVCTQTDEELDQILLQCKGSVKLASVTIVLKVSVSEAEERLERNKGVLAQVFEEAAREKKATSEEGQDDSIVLCVDAGGTSCKAVVMTKDGDMGLGTAGPCNV